MKIFEQIENLKNSKPELTEKLLENLMKEIDCLPDNLLNYQVKSTGDTILHKLTKTLLHSQLVDNVITNEIKNLVKRGAKIDIQNKVFKTPIDLLFNVSNLEILTWLKENNCIEFKDDHILKTQNKEVLNYLLNLGLNLNATNKLGTNLLYYTILNQDIDFACYLIKEKKIEIKNGLLNLHLEDILDFLFILACRKDDDSFKIVINYLQKIYEINNLLDDIANQILIFEDDDEQYKKDKIKSRRKIKKFLKPFYQN
jgi:ankyrin repeat protein